MDISSVKERVISSDLTVKALIQEILSCETSWEDYHSLHREVVKSMTAQKCAVDELQNRLPELRRVSDRKILESELEGFRTQLESNYYGLKKASSQSRRVLQDKTQTELFSVRSSPEEDSSLRKRRLDKETISKKASSVTENLLSISQMMASQVTLSEQSLNTLVTSSATVTETQEEFKMMNSLLGQSRKLLSKYGRREVTDKVLILLALAFFFACCLYVVLKRLL